MGVRVGVEVKERIKMEQTLKQESRQELKQELECPLCHEGVYSGIGKGCKMCAMPLDDKNKKFCSEICKAKYRKINKFQEVKNGR